ncbi:hypothetical protein KAI04_00015 [Candidatus Pacearchaeota archaeon]|nr:hypothetical protein [Candidatus Pacearchaeota archaeon]
MGDGEEFLPGEHIIICPKCKNQMEELDQGEMTEGQQADYDAGFNHPYECGECGFHGLFEVPSIYDGEDDEIDYDSFEIEKAQIPIAIEEISTYSTILGIIIREAIEIEYLLDKIIKEYYLEDQDKKEKFEKDVLRKEFFSFEQKRKVLVRMNLKDISKNFYEKIKWIQEIRNQVAHILGDFDNKKRVYFIKYKQGKDEKEIILNKNFIQSFQHECYTIKKELEKISDLLK